MQALVVTKDINAPAPTVWRIITDLPGSVDRLSSVTAIEHLAGPKFGVGTRWRETRTMFGKSASEEMTVTAVAKGRSYTVEADSSGAHYISVMSVEPTDAGSRLKMTFDATSDKFMVRLMGATVGRLFAGATKKALQKDLDEIAAAAQAAA